jgi:hypothetical protein
VTAILVAVAVTSAKSAKGSLVNLKAENSQPPLSRSQEVNALEMRDFNPQ